MDKSSELQEIIDLTNRLVQGSANKRKGTLAVSPEAAAYYTAIPGRAPGEDSSAPAAPGPYASMAELEDAVAGCTKCSLCESRTQTVFADGDPEADLVFIGEAPGADEDRQGVPFVGRAGQLLTRIIENGMKIGRGEVYICNVLKCRPPNNRDPLAAEKRTCMPYLEQQLEFVQPKVICCLGRHAANAILGTDEGTGRLRGKWHFYKGVPVRVTYHPSYLLRLEREPERLNEEKKKVWADVQEVMKVLSGAIVPAPGD